MADVAYTTIRHGKDDGTVVVVNEGDEVKGLPSEVVKDLKEQKLIGPKTVSSDEVDAEKAEMQAKIDELEAKLAESQAAATKSTPATPSK